MPSDRLKLAVDRIACTGHGICAHLLAGQVSLDAHGYPILKDPTVPRRDGETAIRLCPARALWERRRR